MMLLEQDLSEFLSKINLDKFLDECESRFPLFSEMAGHSGYDVEDKKSLASFLELLNDIQNVGVAGVSPCGFTYNDEISDFYYANQETIDETLKMLAEQDEAFGQVAQDDDDGIKVYVILEYGAGSLMGTDLENFDKFVERHWGDKNKKTVEVNAMASEGEQPKKRGRRPKTQEI